MNKTEKPRRRLIHEVGYFFLGAFIGTIFLLVSLWWISREAILPNITIAGVAVGGMTHDEASRELAQYASRETLRVTYGGGTWYLPTDLYSIDIPSAVNSAMLVGKRWDPAVFGQLITGKVEIPLTIALDEARYASWSGEIESAASIVAQPAKISYDGKAIVISNGEDGVVLESQKLKKTIADHLATLTFNPIEAPTIIEPASLSDSQQARVREIAENLVGDQLTLIIEDDKVTLGTKELISFVSLDPDEVGEIDSTAIHAYIQGVAERYNREPQDAKFAFADGRVREFAPGRDGITLDLDATTLQMTDTVRSLTQADASGSVTAILRRTPPKVSTSEVNNLGITERIGRGESYYAHSIANRVFNVGLAASRVNGALVSPGEEFSFNKFVGEISGATGYKTAYVISGGRTVLGDGGGVCQVSTTLFRAAMDAGLPITERWGHAYRVGYYEQNSDPGIDATVYSPSKDFKFVNDTQQHILIQAINDPKNLHLVFEIYGTSDGRKATVTKPKVWGITPPPPDLYEDDPNLPAGTVKQVDWAAWGAKTSFDYTVERGGEKISEKTYSTTYRPWQNVYIRGTGGVVTP